MSVRIDGPFAELVTVPFCAMLLKTDQRLIEAGKVQRRIDGKAGLPLFCAHVHVSVGRDAVVGAELGQAGANLKPVVAAAAGKDHIACADGDAAVVVCWSGWRQDIDC